MTEVVDILRHLTLHSTMRGGYEVTPPLDIETALHKQIVLSGSSQRFCWSSKAGNASFPKRPRALILRLSILYARVLARLLF